MRRRRVCKLVLICTVSLALVVVLGTVLLWQLTVRRLVAESTIAETPLGPIEYAAFGQPRQPAVLFVHGSPGGYDQLLPLAQSVASRGYRGLTVSRPGYLRTPQAVGTTPEEQADALAALLRSLDLGAVVVTGVSGGGPSTLQLALRHPDLVRGVVLICAVTLRYRDGDPDPKAVSSFDLRWDLGALAGRWSPAFGLRLLGVDDRRQRRALLADETTAAAVRYLFQSLGFSARRRGYGADMLAIEWNDLDYPLASLDKPILLLHGSEDRNVPLAHSQKVASQAPRAELRILEGAGHAFFILQRGWVETQLFDFLDRISQ